MHQKSGRPVAMSIVAVIGATIAVTFAPGASGTVDGSTVSTGASIPVVTAVDQDGIAIDVPYFDGPRGTLLTLRTNDTGQQVQEIPITDWPVLERFDRGLRTATTLSDDRLCSGIEQWPRQTLDNSSCFLREFSAAYPGSGTWFVDVPLTVTTEAGPLVFDRWEQSASTVAGGSRCRTGDQGIYQVPWGDNATGQTNNTNSFSTAAQFRLWIDPQTGVGGGAEVTARYATAAAGTPDTSAPLVSIRGLVDCSWVPRGAFVRATWFCDELGVGAGLNGTGIATCQGWNGTTTIPNNTVINTTTVGAHTLTVTATDVAGNSRTRTIRYFVDAAPPTIDITTAPDGPNEAGWFSAADLEVGGSLPVVASATDEVGGSSMARFACTAADVETVAPTQVTGLLAEPPPVVVTTGAIQYRLGSGEHTVACTAADRSGQTSTAAATFKVDTQPPNSASFYGPQAPFLKRCPGIGEFAADQVFQGVPYEVVYLGGSDAHSGLVVPGSGSLFLDVSTPGERTVQAPTMVDAAGNETPGATCTYFVNAVTAVAPVISAFGPPVNMDAVNVAKAGRTIPFKFSVSRAGVPVTGLTAATSSVSRFACDTDEPTDDLESAGTVGSSGLIDLGGGEYQYNLKTAKSWSDGCFDLGVIIDGADMSARFSFTR